MLEDLGRSLESLAFFTAARESAYAYPILLSTHLACLGLFGGAILATDLRLLGWTFTRVSLDDVLRRLRPWKYAGFVIMVTCGAIIAASNASGYFVNPFFQTKMVLLALVGAHAVVFRRSVYRDPARYDGTATARMAGVLSLTLWIGLLAMGRWIAYFE